MFKKGIVVLLLAAIASGCSSETKLCRNSPPAPLLSVPINLHYKDNRYTLLRGDPRKPGSRWIHYRVDHGVVRLTHDVSRLGEADYCIFYDDGKNCGMYEIKSEPAGNGVFKTRFFKDGIELSQSSREILKGDLEGIFGPGRVEGVNYINNNGFVR